jgi:outer membrane receptor for ferrienterochelin and colicins
MEFQQKGQQILLAGRFFYEDRWGELQWEKKYRGGTDVYGESIYTKRWELVLMNFPLQKKLFSFSYGPRPKLHLW